MNNERARTVSATNHQGGGGLFGSPYKTGKPATLYFAKNHDSSRQYVPPGMDFGVDIEPDGDYLVVSEDALNRGDKNKLWSYGAIHFENPLVLEHKNTRSSGWKKDLSDMFDGKTGAGLTLAIREQGYDGVITVERYRGGYALNESVNICGTKTMDEHPTTKD